MLDRVRIYDGKDSMVHIELKDEHGVAVFGQAMSSSEWKAERDKVIQSFPSNISVSVLTDYIVALANIVELCS